MGERDMILAVLQARMSSTRLPGKVMRPVLGEPMLGRQIERIRRAEKIDQLVLATSVEASDDPLEAYARGLGVDVHRGALDDVLDRFYGAARVREATHVVRLTADCPLADWTVIDACIDLHLERGSEYTSNVVERTYPDGLDVEVMTFAALEAAWRSAVASREREHVTPFLYTHPERFSIAHLLQTPDLSEVRWTVDDLADFEFVEACFRALYPPNPAFTTEDIHRWAAVR